MTFLDEMKKYEPRLSRFRESVRMAPCESFADICWDSVNPLTLEPGVRIEAAARIVIIQRINGEIRYYAGGWGSEESRKETEYEFGVFGHLDNAIPFVEAFLVEQRKPREIVTSRLKKGGTEISRG